MRLSWKNKLRSGALQFTIFISVIIALLLAGTVLLAYTHRFFIEQSKAIIENIQLADTGIAALTNQEAIGGPDTLSILLPDAIENQEIKTHLSLWGIFEKAFVKTTHREKQFIKCALLGTEIKAIHRPALYLKETFKPLVVVGNTKIKGQAFLPEQAIRSGNISGNSYYGTQLVYGAIRKSTPELPKLKYDYKQQLEPYLKEYQHSETNFISLKQGKIINSFTAPVKGYFSEQEVVLDHISLYGHIIIKSATKITIKKTTDLKDIILIAPIIVIEDEVKGNFQAVADTSIKVGKKCLLHYPSALVLIEKQNNTPTIPYDEYNNKISISQGSIIKGSVCYFSTLVETNFKVNILVDSDCTIKGEIYCEGNLELKGSVAGTVFTSQFIANEDSSVFVNHLYNGIIISEDLPEAFGGILFNNESKSIMKWLY